MMTKQVQQTGVAAVRAVALCVALFLALTLVGLIQAGSASAHHGAGLVPRPIMGANPYGYLGLIRYDDTSLCDPNPPPDNFEGCQTPETREVLIAEAEALVRPIPSRADGKSLADLGYNVIQLDGEWQGPRLNPSTGEVDPINGEITPNPIRYPDVDQTNNRYPGDNVDDWIALIQQVKSTCGPVTGYCLQVGIYSSWSNGINCGIEGSYAETRNGLYQHEYADAATFASWGIDFLKLDGADCEGEVPADPLAEFQVIHDAFALNAPNIAIDIYFFGVFPDLSNIWRPGYDMCGCFSFHDDGIMVTLMDQLAGADTAVDVIGPGSWYDMDNLLVSGANGFGSPNRYFSLTEQRTQFGLEALMSSQLLIGADVRTVIGVPGDPNYPGDPAVLDFLANEEVIWINQDPRGDAARCVETDAPSGVCSDGTYDVRSKVLDAAWQGYPGSSARAVGLLNRSDTAQDITFHFDKLRTDDGALNGGLHDLTELKILWSGQQISIPETTSDYTCTSTQCTFFNVPAHGLVMLRAVGTADANVASTGFSAIQGRNRWSYQYVPLGSTAYGEMPLYDASAGWWELGADQPPWALVADGYQHTGDDHDSVRTWTAPAAGTVTITNADGNLRLVNTGSDGVDVYILKNDAPLASAIWSASILNQTGVAQPSTQVTVAAGDQIHFRANKRGDVISDTILWDPQIELTVS